MNQRTRNREIFIKPHNTKNEVKTHSFCKQTEKPQRHKYFPMLLWRFKNKGRSNFWKKNRELNLYHVFIPYELNRLGPCYLTNQKIISSCVYQFICPFTKQRTPFLILSRTSPTSLHPKKKERQGRKQGEVEHNECLFGIWNIRNHNEVLFWQ